MSYDLMLFKEKGGKYKYIYKTKRDIKCYTCIDVKMIKLYRFYYVSFDFRIHVMIKIVYYVVLVLYHYCIVFNF